MLFFSRKLGESIIVGNSIVTIIGFSSGEKSITVTIDSIQEKESLDVPRKAGLKPSDDSDGFNPER